MTDPLNAAADKLKEEINEHVAELKASPLVVEIQKKQKALNALEELLGVPATKLGTILSLGTATEEGAPVEVGPDEFVHLPMLDAAKAYLKKAGKPARDIDEIIAAIRRGGGIVTAVDRLKTQLVRSTSEVKKVSDTHFGLLEWYPARKGRPPGSPNRSAGHADDDDADIEQTTTDDAEAGESPEGDEVEGAPEPDDKTKGDE